MSPTPLSGCLHINIDIYRLCCMEFLLISKHKNKNKTDCKMNCNTLKQTKNFEEDVNISTTVNNWVSSYNVLLASPETFTCHQRGSHYKWHNAMTKFKPLNTCVDIFRATINTQNIQAGDNLWRSPQEPPPGSSWQPWWRWPQPPWLYPGRGAIEETLVSSCRVCKETQSDIWYINKERSDLWELVPPYN